MTTDHPYGAGDTHAQALERLDTASTERSRLRDENERARGTPRELQADVSLQAANDDVAARQRWLQWLETSDH